MAISQRRHTDSVVRWCGPGQAHRTAEVLGSESRDTTGPRDTPWSGPREAQASGLPSLRVRAHQCTALFQLLSRFPAIEHLGVNWSGAQDTSRDLSSSHAQSQPAPLRELRYANFGRGTYGSVEWLRSFDPSSMPTLYVSCVTDGDDLSLLGELREVGMTHPRHPPPALLPPPPGVEDVLQALEAY